MDKNAAAVRRATLYNLHEVYPAMQATILCPSCKKATLNVTLFGPHAEYAAQCPVCGPVFGFVILGFKGVSTEPTDKLPEAQAS